IPTAPTVPSWRQCGGAPHKLQKFSPDDRPCSRLVVQREELVAARRRGCAPFVPVRIVALPSEGNSALIPRPCAENANGSGAVPHLRFCWPSRRLTRTAT